MKLIRVLVSSCLMGNSVRYDGGDQFCDNLSNLLFNDSRIICYAFCPEVSGGLSVPRSRAAINRNYSGYDVLNHDKAKVINSDGIDVTNEYIKGAQLALEFCKKNRISIAIMKEDSPSCGSNTLFNPTFDASKKIGPGVTAALLKKNNIAVFSEIEVEELSKYIKSIFNE